MNNLITDSRNLEKIVEGNTTSNLISFVDGSDPQSATSPDRLATNSQQERSGSDTESDNGPLNLQFKPTAAV